MFKENTHLNSLSSACGLEQVSCAGSKSSAVGSLCEKDRSISFCLIQNVSDSDDVFLSVAENVPTLTCICAIEGM